MTEIEKIKANFLRRDNLAAMERAEDPNYLDRWGWHEEMRTLLKHIAELEAEVATLHGAMFQEVLDLICEEATEES
jgi:hypothetical protein